VVFDDDNSIVYKVVLNHEEQYSIWPVDRDNPSGWVDDGTQGTKSECLDHIERIWTDMRPLSLRQAVASKESADEAPL
jgi:MbtH protein